MAVLDLMRRAATGAGARRGLSVTHLRRAGDRAVRVLMVAGPGARVAVDGGPTAHFTDEVVDRLWLRLRRGLEVDVVQQPGAALRAIAGSSASWHRSRYDLVALVVDPPESLGSRARNGLEAVLRSVLAELVTTTRVVLITLQPEDGSPRHRRSTGFAPDLVDEVAPPAGPLSVLRIPRGRAGSADAVAAHLQAAITGARPAAADVAGAARTPAPRARSSATLERRLAQIASMTRTAFDLDVAAVNLAEHGLLSTIACDGAEPGVQPQRGSLCDLTLDRDGLVVVGDTWAVPSLAAHRAVRAAPSVRFYAGFPIGAAGLAPFGALCVYDRRPRGRDEFDFTLLRDLAMLAEGELIDAGHG